MKLYNANLSPNCLRVRAVAFELGIELDVIDVSIRAGENRTDEFLRLNANAKVPVLVDDDFVLWESRAINSYLCSLQPQHGLYPEDPKARAIVDQWLYWQAIHLGPAMQKVAFERVFKRTFGMGEADEDAVAAGLKESGQFLQVLEDNMAGKEWVAGNLSVVDFAVASTFMFRQPAQIWLAEFPQTASWIERLESRRSWQTAVQPLMDMMAI